MQNRPSAPRSRFRRGSEHMGDILMEQTAPDVMRTASAKPQLATGGLHLFALPFCSFGLFAAVFSIRYLLAATYR